MSHVLAPSAATSEIGAGPLRAGCAHTPTLVLVTEQEVIFSTAAALSPPPAMTRRGWLLPRAIAAIRDALALLPKPQRCYPHPESACFEAARMSREMYRL